MYQKKNILQTPTTKNYMFNKKMFANILL